MFMKPAKSEKKIQKCRLKNIMYSRNWKTGKMKYGMNQNNTVTGWLPNSKKNIFEKFFISKRPAS